MLTTRHSRLYLLAPWVLCFQLAGFVHGQSFQAFGTYCYTNYTPTETVSTFINASFSVAVDREKVYLRFDFAPQNYEEWAFDGTNSYLLIDGPSLSDPNVKKQLSAAATEDENEFPVTPVCLIRTVWLGLGSAHYFDDPTNQPVLVPWGEWGLRGMLSYRWDLHRLSAAPYLPAAITFVASSNLWKKEQAARIEPEEVSFPLREGFIGGQFEVQQTGSLGAMTYPTRFVLKRYRTGIGEGKLLEFSCIQITNLSAFAAANFIPKITRATDVSDMRDSTTNIPRFGITYTLTNDNWLAKSDPHRLAMVEAHKAEYEKWRRSLALKAHASWVRPDRRRIVLVALILSVVSLPLLLAFMRLRGRFPAAAKT